jgi:hypothetical protein
MTSICVKRRKHFLQEEIPNIDSGTWTGQEPNGQRESKAQFLL